MKTTRFYKIYTRDTKNRQLLTLLLTNRNYSEVKSKYGRCEEIFSYEFMSIKRLKPPVEIVYDVKN